MNNRYILLFTFIALIAMPILAQTAVRPINEITVEATAIDNGALRAGPGHLHETIGGTYSGQPVTVLARNDVGQWLKIDAEGVIGWVMIDTLDLPDDYQQGNMVVDTDQLHTDITPFTDEVFAQAYSAPILPEITDSMCEVLQMGIDEGAFVDVVSKVGDSNSVSPEYLATIGNGEVDYRIYDFLRETGDFYSESLTVTTMAAKKGMNSAAVFDPFWATPNTCELNESPLACEYRLRNPSLALIMFGNNDTKVLNRAGWEAQMRLVIEATLAENILPILITFTTDAEKDQYIQAINFNAILIGLAQEYDVPLINFWAVAQALPRQGIGDDNQHLTVSGGRLVFGGFEANYGMTLHNLLVLHTLDRIRETCL